MCNSRYFESIEKALEFVNENGIEKYHFQTPEFLENGVDLVIDESKKYTIIHHSQMTDITVYFIANNSKKLLDNESTINNYLDSNYQENFDSILEILVNNGIKVYTDEFLDTDTQDMIKNAICVKKYSYRF